MATDLYGDTYIDNWDYARKIVTKGIKLPFYYVSSYTTPNKGCSIAFFEEGYHFLRPDYAQIDCAGLYAIYEKKGQEFSCLYTGSSNYSMRQRVYRFVKELHGVSRHDEDHPGGRKARLTGTDPRSIYVKFFPRREFPKAQNVIVNLDTLDETIAILLKSKFNSRKKC